MQAAPASTMINGFFELALIPWVTATGAAIGPGGT
jgi:hypothetical protein